MCKEKVYLVQSLQHLPPLGSSDGLLCGGAPGEQYVCDSSQLITHWDLTLGLHHSGLKIQSLYCLIKSPLS